MNPSEQKHRQDVHKPATNRQFGDDPWIAAGLVGSVGVALGVTLTGGYWLGTFYDDKFETQYGMICGLLLGLIIGIGSAILLIRTYTGSKK